MQELIFELINQFGYLAIALLIAAENIFPPIPSEVILTLGGFMTTYSDLNVWMVIFSATVGALIGALILYRVGGLITPRSLQKLLSGKMGSILHLNMGDISKASHWFAQKGTISVFFCRFIPVLRSLISIPAGTAKINLVVFLVLTTLGSAIWNTVLVWLGALAGESWGDILQYLSTYSVIIWAVLGLGLLIAVRSYWRRKQ